MGRSRSVLVEVGQFVAAGLVALAIVAFATSIAARRAGEREAIADVRATTVLRAQGVVAPALDDALLAGDQAALERLDRVVSAGVLDDDLVRVKLWTADGTIVYADQAELIGERFELGQDELEAMATGAIEAEVSDLAEPENRFDREFDKLLEVYLPVRTPGGEILLFEAYHRYELVTANANRLWRSFAPIAIGALVMLEVVQIPLAVSLARRLRQRQAEREGLLRRALESSERERRQIASDLHDGVVQDLAGVAFSLSAAARRPRDPAADGALLEDAAGTVRAGNRALRSLLVDIYPPDFDEVTLESALRDLAVRMGERDVALQVDAAGLDADLPDAVARLLYRVAQEGVRNVLRHADASRVTIVVEARSGTARLEVVDDGRGFDADELPTSAATGHLGLTALGGLVHDAGGTLETRSEPGAGTALRVEVPIP